MNLKPFVIVCLCFVLWPLSSFSAGSLKDFMYDSPKLMPNISFKGANGTTYSLRDFRGKVLLVNLWASWCSPCVEELPSLDRLQAKLKDSDVRILPLSMDNEELPRIKNFLTAHQIKNLPVLEGEMSSLSELGIAGIPATIIIDRQGHEIGRVMGGLKWDNPIIVRDLKGL